MAEKCARFGSHSEINHPSWLEKEATKLTGRTSKICRTSECGKLGGQRMEKEELA